MDVFNVLTMIGGLSLFLFGMNIMAQALERRAGGKMHAVLTKMTTKKLAGFMTGCGVTAVIQSSSATTVMVVGFVNSGLMTLKQAINVIMGANVGTTITAWILSLGGISGTALWVMLLKPSSFTPILALIGIIFYMFSKNHKRKDTGMILLGFATLMFGMETMTGAVSGLADVPQFQQLFVMFENPFLGLLAGAVLTMVIQSSSASVGILQALAATGQVTFGAAVPIVMGTSVGTCVTAMLSSIGAKKEAKRAAVVHLLFNVIGACIWLSVCTVIRMVFEPGIFSVAASLVGIAIVNTAFNALTTVILLPASSVLEKLAIKIVPDATYEEKTVKLDERLLATPPLALGQAHSVAIEMAEKAIGSMQSALGMFTEYSKEKAAQIRADEKTCDEYEDAIGTYLVQLSAEQLGQKESEEAAALLKVIGDFERISDHAVTVLESAEELRDKKISLSKEAMKEYAVIAAAVEEALGSTMEAFRSEDSAVAATVEPLKQVIAALKERLRTNHIRHMQEGKCTAQAGFVWADIMTSLESASGHCSNIAGCVIDAAEHNLNVHESLRKIRHGSEEYFEMFKRYSEQYALVK